MNASSPISKTLSSIAAGLILSSTLIPVSTASAHDRHNNARHFGNGVGLSQQEHRRFHRTYGRGQQGTIAYRKQFKKKRHKAKRQNRNGDLIAAGIIGLAVGAIIAGESARTRQPQYRTYTPREYYPAPSSRDYYGSQEPYYGDYNYGDRRQPLSSYQELIQLPQYDTRVEPSVDGGPSVVTFNDPSDLQPWTPGWREWCDNRYRSFNPTTGTFRGYDGLDHFCVPK